MKNPRRSFLRNSSLTLGGLICGVSTTAAAVTSAETDVLAVVRAYGTIFLQKRLNGESYVKVRINSHADFARVFVGRDGIPFDRIHADGNLLRFQHRGEAFVIENFV